MTKYLAAHTPASPPAPAMVAYINAYLLDNGMVRVTVRQQCDDPASEDVELAFIDMEPERAFDFANEFRESMKVFSRERDYDPNVAPCDDAEFGMSP